MRVVVSDHTPLYLAWSWLRKQLLAAIVVNLDAAGGWKTGDRLRDNTCNVRCWSVRYSRLTEKTHRLALAGFSLLKYAYFTFSGGENSGGWGNSR